MPETKHIKGHFHVTVPSETNEGEVVDLVEQALDSVKACDTTVAVTTGSDDQPPG